MVIRRTCPRIFRLYKWLATGKDRALGRTGFGPIETMGEYLVNGELRHWNGPIEANAEMVS